MLPSPTAPAPWPVRATGPWGLPVGSLGATGLVPKVMVMSLLATSPLTSRAAFLGIVTTYGVFGWRLCLGVMTSSLSCQVGV